MGSLWRDFGETDSEPGWVERVSWLAAALTPREATRLLLCLDLLLAEGEGKMGRQLTLDERDYVAQTLRHSATRNS